MARGATSINMEKVLADAVKVRDRVALRLVRARQAVLDLDSLEQAHKANEETVAKLGGDPFDFAATAEDGGEQ